MPPTRASTTAVVPPRYGWSGNKSAGEKEGGMRQRLWFIGFVVVVLTCTLGGAPVLAALPEGTLTVAVATFGNERWLPHQYVAAEDIVLKPMLENLLSRDIKTGAM